MRLALFLCLWLSHLIADFVLQTASSCKNKAEGHWCSKHQYIHMLIVAGLAWLVSWDLSFWWGALLIGITHLGVDIWKSYRPESVIWFALDQALHIGVLVGVTLLWCSGHEWSLPQCVELKHVAFAIATLVCWKPANIFIKLMLKYYSVNMPENKESGFNAGALIGTVERWLILIFVCLQRYDALGLLIAAKSIIRFGDKETAKTEYVLAGTLLSIFIAVLAGMMVTLVW